jgi:NADPH oxidase 1
MKSDTIEIQFSKPSMSYKPGQWLYINVPSVSRQQWHPFTITSCPFDPYVSIHVRQVGDFTRALASALGAGHDQRQIYNKLDPMGLYKVDLESHALPKIRIDGPYGAPAEDVLDNEVAVLIGTGIGITPWASILKHIWNLRLSSNPPGRLRMIEFVWVCKDPTTFQWFQALLLSLEAQNLGSKNGFLRLHTYITKIGQPDSRLSSRASSMIGSLNTENGELDQLSKRTILGRPNFDRLMAEIRDGIQDNTYLHGILGKDKTKVGVYFCGPNVAAKSIKRACASATTDKIRFQFWKEHF